MDYQKRSNFSLTDNSDIKIKICDIQNHSLKTVKGFVIEDLFFFSINKHYFRVTFRTKRELLD